MAIEERLCACGCGKSKAGTERLMYFSGACKLRDWRRKQKEKESTDAKVDNKD